MYKILKDLKNTLKFRSTKKKMTPVAEPNYKTSYNLFVIQHFTQLELFDLIPWLLQ